MKTVKVKAVVEKGSDGLFSVYSEDHFGNSYFGGFGDSVAKAKEDFLVSIRESINEQASEGKDVPNFEDVSVEYRYDIPSFFDFFDFINVSRFAQFAGINESKMRAYKSGVSFPGEKTTQKIIDAAHKIAAELSSTTLH
jgi:hypothetical protein